MSDQDDGFLSRWARRKALARQGKDTQPPAADVPAQALSVLTGEAAQAAPVVAATPDAEAPAPSAAEPAAPPPPPPPPTLEDVALLDRDAADYSRFVAKDVQPDVRNAALKKLFTDPHFNVMDGLDIYIDDYSQPDPLPPGMLERMAQSQFLGLFTQAPDDAAAAESPAVCPSSTPEDLPDGVPDALTTQHPSPLPPPDENADLRLQPHDAAGRPGPAPGAGPPAGCAG